MRTVLVADGDEASRLAVSAILQSKGLGVVMASDAARAHTVLEDNPSIAGIVTDVALSAEQDTRFFAQLRADARYQELPIIVVGSNATVRDVMVCLEQGASRFVAKCALGEGLSEEIDAVLMI